MLSPPKSPMFKGQNSSLCYQCRNTRGQISMLLLVIKFPFCKFPMILSFSTSPQFLSNVFLIQKKERMSYSSFSNIFSVVISVLIKALEDVNITVLLRNIIIGLYSNCRAGVNRRKEIPCSQTDFIFLENERFPKSYNDSKISQQSVKLPHSLPFIHKERSYCQRDTFCSKVNKLLVNQLITCLIK